MFLNFRQQQINKLVDVLLMGVLYANCVTRSASQNTEGHTVDVFKLRCNWVTRISTMPGQSDFFF